LKGLSKAELTLRELRVKKRQLKKAWKQLRTNGTSHALHALKVEWRKVMKQHSCLARRVRGAEENRRLKSQQRSFDKDPFLFGRKLFEKKSVGEPQFSAEQAFNFFASNYRDEKRGTTYSKMESMISPNLPSFLISELCPSLTELRASARQKRNAAAPGLNGLSYVLYKRCPCVLPVVHKIVQKVWRTNSFPSGWATAFIRLLPKSQKLTEPGEFRPMNTVSKIFLSVVGPSLLWFKMGTFHLFKKVQS
jgi:hypothetical protein